MLVYGDVWEWVWDQFSSITGYSNTSSNASGNTSVAADARCGYTLRDGVDSIVGLIFPHLLAQPG